MQVSSRKQTNTYAAFMGIALLAAAGVVAISNPSTWVGSLPVPMANGEWATLYGKNFDKTLLLTEPARQAFGTLSYIGFREGRPGVLVGTDGWLFTDEEMSKLDAPQVALDDKIAFIRAAQSKAASAGTQVIVALVPAKLRVYGDHAGRYAFMPKLQPVYNRTLASLNAGGVPTADLLTPFMANRAGTQLFLKTDTHWTPEGAGVAAQAVARAIGQRRLLSGTEARADFALAKGRSQDHRGDLLSFLPLLDGVKSDAPQPDKIRTGEAVSRAAQGSDALLGEAEIPVALVGSSYSFDPRWQFIDQLKVALHADILNAAQEGQGPFVPMARYLHSREFREKPPKLVIWEIPERYLWSSAKLPRL